MTRFDLVLFSLTAALLAAGLIAHLLWKLFEKVYYQKKRLEPVWWSIAYPLRQARGVFLSLGAGFLATFAVFWLAEYVFNALKQYV